jgi:hypothetical protein
MPKLPIPTVKRIKAKYNELCRKNQLDEDALRILFTQFPRNIDTSHVLLKVLALNKLYKTQINDIDVEPLARHIAGHRIDSLLTRGSPRAVEVITNCPSLQKKHFSFATKYCSWHNPTAYPIYDRNVVKCLCRYDKKKRFKAESFYQKDLRDFKEFLAVISAFRSFYALNAVTFKELDKYLWYYGQP